MRVDEREGMREVYAASASRLMAQVYAMTGDFLEAQDVVQEAFARALAAPGWLRRVDNPEAWLRTVALNLARSRHRRRLVFDRLARTGLLHPAGAHEPSLSPDHVALVRALQRLPVAIRKALVLHHIADLPVKEVAEIEGCSVDAIKTRLARGRRALAVALDDELPPDPPERVVLASNKGIICA
ncbi:SigE family RNA polymerase sigma factor [Rugosimonospora acidiphila]|uniref:RNA polymerase sigma factor n=1 Tax=Rugosimonospora acidiphila TaxID=556531 RepID=A0ABP9STV4_9ACTN